MEDFYHNDIKEFYADTVKQYLKKKRWKRRTKKSAIQFIQKFAPEELEVDKHIMLFSIEYIRAIASLKNEDVDISEEAISSEMIKICINTLNLEHMIKEEQVLWSFTRNRLKRLSSLQEWKNSETKQIDQFMVQRIFGNPINPVGLPESAVILRTHWKYSVKQSEVQISRMCCNGSKNTAPQLHAVTSTLFSCLELPVQRLFLCIAADL